MRCTGLLTPLNGSLVIDCAPFKPRASATPPLDGKSAMHAAILAPALEPANWSHLRTVLSVFINTGSAVAETFVPSSVILEFVRVFPVPAYLGSVFGVPESWFESGELTLPVTALSPTFSYLEWRPSVITNAVNG